MEKISVLQIEYSSACNMANVCKHCYGATGIVSRKQQLTEQVLSNILEEAKYITDFVTITGGEPSVFPDIVRRIQNNIGVPFFLMTNGFDFIDKINPFSVLFSLDAQDIRPGIDCDRVIQNVLRYNCNLACNTVLSRDLDIFDYYDKVKKIDRKLKERDNHVREWKLGFVIDKGKAVSNNDIFPDLDLLFKDLGKFLRVYFSEKPFTLAIRGFLYTKFMNDNFVASIKNYRLNLKSNPCLDCYGRGEILTVNVDGSVQMCTVCREVSSPIEEGLIEAVSKLIQKDEFRGLTYEDWKDCISCRYFQICGCGCPSLAMTYNGKWTGKDVFQCELMEKWEKYILPVLPSKMRDSFLSLLK